MPLLSDEILARLPKMGEQDPELESTVYARLYIPDTSRNWYVIEGEMVGSEYMVYGVFTNGDDYSFGDIRLSVLEATFGPDGQPVVPDLDFKEGLLSDVVPAPDS